VMHGDLKPGEPLTRQSYLRTQAKARAMGILDGVAFHKDVFKDQASRDGTEPTFMYEHVRCATDYAVNFGRDRYWRAGASGSREDGRHIVTYLNALNAPYRSGLREFQLERFWRNIGAHLAHNALAHAGLWPEWGTGPAVA